MSKPWYYSKTKLGGVFLGIGLICNGVGNILTEQSNTHLSIEQIILGISSILIVTGIRDAINKE